MRLRSFCTLTLLILNCVSCGSDSFEPVKRPPGVPQKAIWAGGADGGSYIWCDDADPALNANFCTVWNDYNGDVIEDGHYRILMEGRAATKEELVYAWADRGGQIGLKSGKVLSDFDNRPPR